MTTEIRPVDLDWVVAFVNGYGTEPGRVAGEERVPRPTLDSLGGLRDVAEDLAEAQMVTLADRLYRVFASSSHARVAEALNGLLAGSRPSPRLLADEAGGGYGMLWEVPTEGSAPLAAACALALLEALGASRRLGVCGAARCVDAFVDRSPGGGRKYCSSLCQNRMKVAAFRRRRAVRGD